MSERDDCINSLVARSEGRLKRADVEDLLGAMLDRAERDPSQTRSFDQKLAEASRKMQENFAERAAVERRNEMMDGLKAIDRHRFYDKAPNPKIALEAKLVGTNVPFAGNRLSVAAQHLALRKELYGGFVNDLEKNEVMKLFASRSIEKEWAQELHEINRGEFGKPGVTGNAEAKLIAETIHKWQKTSVDALNAEGGWIKSYSGYITRTTHDPDKIRRMGKDAWVDETLARLDVVRTFGDPDPAEARKTLGELWVKFKNGDHFDYAKPLTELDDVISLDLARKVSAHRELHFKSADDWFAYNEKFGMYSPTETVARGFDNAARNTALMREFGTEPRLAFEQDLAFLKTKFAGTEHRVPFDKFEQALRNRFDQLDGAASRPVNRLASRITTGWLAIERLTKLGLTPITMLNDLMTKASELRYQGVGALDRYSSALSGYFRGAEGSDKRVVADLLNAGVNARIGNIASRFDAADTPHGVISRAENWFFRMTGITPMTENQRADAEVIMSRHLGMQKGKAWEDVGTNETRLLTSFGIEKSEWELLNKLEWTDVGGTTYLTPDVARKASDADLKALLVERGRLRPESEGGTVTHLIGKERDGLALKLHAYFADRGEYAILEPGARTRAMLYQGTQPGTPLGVALRLFMQFKQFPATMIEKTWGRELYGGQGRMETIAGLTEFIVGSTALGVVSNMLNKLVKGQDPFAEWEKHPVQSLLAGFIKGGAGTIYGDFVLGEWSRFGMSAAASVAGPTFGQIDRVAELWSDITHGKGKNAGALALRIGREHLPFMNMIYTKAAFDYLIFYRMQEAINPGYLARMEAKMKEKNGTEFLLRPSQISR